MSRPSALGQIPEEVRERIARRSRWPPALLAEILGCCRETVYRHFPGGGQIRTEEILAAIAAAHERGHAGEKLATDLGG